MIRFYIKMKRINNSKLLWDKIQTKGISLTDMDECVWCYGSVQEFREFAYILYWCQSFSGEEIEISYRKE